MKYARKADKGSWQYEKHNDRRNLDVDTATRAGKDDYVQSGPNGMRITYTEEQSDESLVRGMSGVLLWIPLLRRITTLLRIALTGRVALALRIGLLWVLLHRVLLIIVGWVALIVFVSVLR